MYRLAFASRSQPLDKGWCRCIGACLEVATCDIERETETVRYRVSDQITMALIKESTNLSRWSEEFPGESVRVGFSGGRARSQIAMTLQQMCLECEIVTDQCRVEAFAMGGSPDPVQHLRDGGAVPPYRGGARRVMVEEEMGNFVGERESLFIRGITFVHEDKSMPTGGDETASQPPIPNRSAIRQAASLQPRLGSFQGEFGK